MWDGGSPSTTNRMRPPSTLVVVEITLSSRQPCKSNSTRYRTTTSSGCRNNPINCIENRKDLELDAVVVVLVEGPVELLIGLIPAGVHHSADGAGAEKEVGLPQLQMVLRVAPLLVKDLADGLGRWSRRPTRRLRLCFPSILLLPAIAVAARLEFANMNADTQRLDESETEGTDTFDQGRA